MKRYGFSAIIHERQQNQQLRAVLTAMLPEYKDHRDTVFHCLSNKDGEYDTEGDRQCIEAMDQIIRDAEEALKP